MTIETKHIDNNLIQLKFDDTKNTFTGYASTFNNVDSYNDTILPGAYKSVITSGEQPKMFFNHKHDSVPIGKWVGMSEDDTGLKIEGELFDGHSLVNDIKLALKAGAITGLSIGYGLKKDDYYYKEDIRYIKNISSLREVSIVTFPADSFAQIDVETIKSEISEYKNIKDFEKYLRESCNFSRSAAKAFVAEFKACLQRDVENEKQQKTDELIQTLSSFKLK